MANKEMKFADNAEGKYYVDEACIASKLCVGLAPRNFKMADAGHAVVTQQPETPAEEEQVRQAVAGCPVNAIGDDGDV